MMNLIGDQFLFGRAADKAILSKKLRMSLYEYSKAAWPIIEPGVPFVDSWHVEVVCRHLQALSEGVFNNLIICIPPGHLKSTLASVMWPSWVWLSYPNDRTMLGSYDEKLVFRDSIKSRDIIKSFWYNDIFKPQWYIRKDVDSKGNYENTLHGSRKSYFIGSRFKTGWRGSTRALDDPLSAEDRYNSEVKLKVIDSHERVMSTRLNDPATAKDLIVMQRLADDDLVGYLLKNKPGRYVYLMLPTEFDPDRKCVTPIFEDPRKEKGELLFPAMYSREVVEDLKISLGVVDFEAQYNHNPASEGGGIFNRSDFLYWKYATHDGDLIQLFNRDGSTDLIRLSLLETFVSVDVAVSQKQTNDWTVFLVWAITPKKQMILLERYKEKLQEPESIRLAMKIYEFRRRATIPHSRFCVESNGVGLPFCQNLLEKGIPVDPINVHKDKRAMSVTASVRIKSGQIYFADPSTNPWMHDFESTLVNFPVAAHDDDVSALSIAANSIFDELSLITGHESGRYEPVTAGARRSADLAKRGLFGVEKKK